MKQIATSLLVRVHALSSLPTCMFQQSFLYNIDNHDLADLVRGKAAASATAVEENQPTSSDQVRISQGAHIYRGGSLVGAFLPYYIELGSYNIAESERVSLKRA